MKREMINWWWQAGYDASYAAVLAKISALGYTAPTAAKKAKQNQFVKDLKAQGIWNSLDWLYLFDTDGDRNAATINFKSPSTFQCTEVGTLTFTSGVGFTGDGSTGYLNTGWNPSANGVNFTQNDASIGAYVNNSPAAGTFSLLGADDVGNTNSIQIVTQNSVAGNAVSGRINSNSTLIGSVQASRTGLWMIQRTGAATDTFYKNGSAQGTGAQASSGRTAKNITILALNDNGAISGFSTEQVRMAFAGASLTGKETAFSTAFNTYIS